MPTFESSWSFCAMSAAGASITQRICFGWPRSSSASTIIAASGRCWMNCHNAEGPAFAAACRTYSELLAQSIIEDRRSLAALDCDPLVLGQFYEWESETDALARPHAQVLHRLEMKYTSPHCI